MTEEPVNEVGTPGGSVGARIASLIVGATTLAKQKAAPHAVNTAVKVFTDATNHVSDEVRSVMGPVFQSALEHPDFPEAFKPLFRQLSSGRGQAWAWIAGSVTGLAAAGGLMDAFNNAWRPVVYPLIRAAPNLVLSASDAAAAAVRGLREDDEMAEEAASSGVRHWRYEVLKKLNMRRPEMLEVVELYRRRVISSEQAKYRLRLLGFQEEDLDHILTLWRVPLSGEQLAAMQNRSIVTPEEGEHWAREAGTPPNDYQRLVELAGEPLGPEALGEAYRRGIINKERFNRGIIQGPVRNEWFDVLEALQLHRMSAVDAADAVNQGHMPLDDARNVAIANGLDPDDFAVLLKVAGAPPGIEFMIDALNRGVITESTFNTAFLESRIKNVYLPVLKAMRYKLIPQETVRLMNRNGVYSDADTIEALMSHGYRESDAAAMLALEKARRTDTTKELTRTTILEMYEQQMLNLQETVEALIGLGFDEDDAHAMIELADLMRLNKFVNAAIGRIRSAFISGKMDETTASAQLDALSIRADQRDSMLALWDIDRTTVSKTLTAAQIRQAVNHGLMVKDEALYRLVSQGYAPDDADLFLRLTA